MTRRARLTIFFTCAAAVAAALETTGGQEGPGAPIRQLAYLKASNSDAFDHFACGGSLPGHIGNALAVSGDGNTIAVGAPHESSAARGINGNQDDNSLYNSGAVYVYVRRGDAWTQQAYLKASNAGQSDQFGLSLSLSRDGNTLAVAAPWEASAATGVNGNQQDDSIPQAGAVYVFTRAGNTWSQHSYIKASNTGRKGVGDDIEGDQFGFSISVSGDGNTLAVGAVGEDSNATGIDGVQTDDSAAGSGAVYVFTKTGNTWAQQAYLKSSNSEAADLFGYGVGLSGDGNALAVAGYDEDGSGKGINPSDCDIDTFPSHLAGGSAGAAYVWTRRGDTWAEQAFIKASNPDLEDWFAVRIALNADGSRLFVGAPMEDSAAKGVNGAQDDDSAEDSGAAYLYERSGMTWRQLAYIKASNTEAYDEFGSSVAISGDGRTILAGARMKDEGAGAAYLFATR